MLKPFLFLACLFNPGSLLAQYKVHLKIDQRPLAHSQDSVYAAGSFNNWVPGDREKVFTSSGEGKLFLDLNLAAGNFQYKITRGNWNTVEASADGKGIGNRECNVSSDTTIVLKVAAWNDDFKGNVQKKHTSSPQVTVMDTAFMMPQLDRSRKIWLYLPIGYATSKKRYPVIYMHDGQNLFDEFTSGNGEWGIDECLDSLHKKGKDCIIVGIDNGPKRITEYNPYDFGKYGKGEGYAYIDFLVESLKPYIDQHYRTLKDKSHTIIAGSSLGGLISMAAVMRYPATFGGAGIFSPAFWIAPQLEIDLAKSAPLVNSKLFFYAGIKESKEMVPDMKRIENILSTSTKSDLKEVLDGEAKHNESAWRKYFPNFITWILR